MISFPFIANSFSYVQNVAAQQLEPEYGSCVKYDPAEKIIRVICKYTTLTEIQDQLRDPSILHKETLDGVWLLNAGIIIEKNTTLYINSTDTLWLKIVAEGENAHAIRVLGSLKIDSTKVSSWNPERSDYLKFRMDKKIPSAINAELLDINRVPRPYIFIDQATGTTNITNSELAYLGYDCNDSECHGLVFNESTGNIIKGNNIHHNNRGFYSSELGQTILENNHVHSNYDYGIDPHTATHDLVIRNNTAYNNGGVGIICSLDCYNITMENNRVYNNVVAGMMISRNTYDSVIRNNNISHESTGISISESQNNKIYNNTLLDVKNGIDVKKNSAENILLDNIIKRAPNYGFRITEDTTGNILESNTIIDTPNNRSIIAKSQIEEDDEDIQEKKNIFIANEIINAKSDWEQL
jgi:mannuronan 5-epimerase